MPQKEFSKIIICSYICDNLLDFTYLTNIFHTSVLSLFMLKSIPRLSAYHSDASFIRNVLFRSQQQQQQKPSVLHKY